MVHPISNLLHSFVPEVVDAAGSVHARIDEPGVTQDAQVAGRRGLTDAELARDERTQLPCGALPGGEMLNDPLTSGVRQSGKLIHVSVI